MNKYIYLFVILFSNYHIAITVPDLMQNQLSSSSQVGDVFDLFDNKYIQGVDLLFIVLASLLVYLFVYSFILKKGLKASKKSILRAENSVDKVKETILSLQLSLDTTVILLWYIENECLYVFKNDSFIKIEMTSSIFETIHIEDRDRYLSMYKDLLSCNDISGGASKKDIFRLFDEATNDYMYFECTLKAIVDVNGNLLRVVGRHFDLTEHEKHEIEINHLRICLDVAMQASNVLAWKEDLHTGENEVLYGFAKGVSYDKQGLSLDCIHPKDIDKYKNYHDKIIAREEVESPILINIIQGDESSCFECTMSLLSNELDECTLLIGSLKDLSEISELNKTLKNLYNESQILLQSLPVGIALYNKEGKQQYINDSLAQTFGVEDIEEHLKKEISFYDDPILSEDKIEMFRKGESFDILVEYDLQVANDHDFFHTLHKHVMYIDAKIRTIRDSDGHILKYILIINDITEKHQAALILANSEENLKLALNAGSVDAWTYDIKSEVFYSLGENNATGYGRISLSDAQSQIHLDDIKLHQDLMDDLIQGRADSGHIFVRQIEINGITRYCDIYMLAKKSSDKVVAITVALKDITKNYLHETELEYSRKRIEFAVNSAELTLWEYNVITETFTSYSDAIIGLNLVGDFTVDEYYKYLNADEPSENDLRRIVTAMNQGIDKSTAIDIKINPKSTPGSECMYCTVGGTPFEYNKDGMVVKYAGFIKDNTKWIHLNDLLVERNTQLKNVLDIGDILPFVCEMKDDLFVITTPYERDNMSFESSDRGVTLTQLLSAIDSRDRDDFRDLSDKILNGDTKEFCKEVRWSKKDLCGMVSEVHMSVIHNDDSVDGSSKWVGYVQNITERRQMILDLEKAKLDAERSERLKSKFLANMSHEIRTPLNAIVGFSELLIEEEDSESKAEYMSIIATNNDLLLKLISDVLDLSKIDAGFTEIDISDFDLSQCFSELHLSMQQRITHSDVVLSIVNPHRQLIVSMDRNRVSQVCLNFITNAIKYTPNGTIEMGYEYINNGIRFSVKDTGIGISEDKKSKVFHRFEKLDDFAQGTGLGLSITKALVDTMKGEIGFDSEEGVGSMFWAWIPCDLVVAE